MVEGPVKIVMAIKEPENRHILWMRPYLDKEGYELLYYGSKGWTRWLPCCSSEELWKSEEDEPLEEPKKNKEDEFSEQTSPDYTGDKEDKPLEEIPPNCIRDREGTAYEVSPSVFPPKRKTSCGCPN